MADGSEVKISTGGLLTDQPQRDLNVEELQLVHGNGSSPTFSLAPPDRSLVISEDDAVLKQIRDLLADGFAGVILTGPPGTSKTWYAEQAALALTRGDEQKIRFVQFHPSYQYEDFVEGYVPDASGGFHLEDKHLLQMCEEAESSPEQTCVLVIDELSRSDPGRVFGEALTYIEMTKRDQPFRLPSGRPVSIPKNLICIATMNPLDRGVEEVDAALERRFAKISMDPDPEILRQFLNGSGVSSDLQTRIIRFFNILRNHENPYCQVGHAYFSRVRDVETIRRLWDYQLKFHLQKATRLDPREFERLERLFKSDVLNEPT